MKPYKTLLVLLVFLVFLFGPSFIIDGPLRLSPGLSLDFPSLPEGLLQLVQPASIAADRVIPEAIMPDTLPPAYNTFDSLPAIDSSLPLPDYEPVQFADSSSLWLSFIDSLFNGRGQLRIIYYGDSQLEGDRITDELRSQLRTIRGGTGPGLLSPTMLVQYTRTAFVRSSSNWKRYTYLSYRSGEIARPELGPMMSISRFTSPDDSLEGEKRAWIKIAPSIYSDSLAAIYDRVRLFYGSMNDSLFVKVSAARAILSEDTLFPVEGIAEYSVPISSRGEITIDLAGRSGPDIFGFSIESDSGIIVDNIPGRGSAGLEFSLIEPRSLMQLYNMLDPDLLILHYGLNVVLNQSSSYQYYENALFRQLVQLQKMLPGTALLVVGVTDMAKEENGEIHSFENLPLIRDAQRNAALRAGALFWDSRQAMGGEDAIVEWKENDPPLASDDYTHLSYEGGGKLARELVKGIVAVRTAVEPLPADTIAMTAVADTILTDLVTEDIISETNLNRGGEIWRMASRYDSSQPYIFTSMRFWLFLMVLLVGYSLLFSKPVLRNSYLFLFSLFFYFKSGGLFFVLLVVSTLTDYFAGLLIFAVRGKGWKRLFLLFSLLVNLGMLGYFKYAGFITGVINDLFNTSIPVNDWLALFSNRQFGSSFDISTIILPVGISFFTFQTISYTMDVYRGRVEPVRNILDFGFYVSFFPQLVAGPIVRASEFIPQLSAKFSLTSREWSHALFLIISGLVKKVVISDYISVNLIDRVFANPEMFSGFENLVSVYGYGLQIYCDFSGYTDIAIGVALMLGYRLPVNFNSPYKADSITDFWRRWHISLSRWLKDYLYISLGGNRKGRFRTNINLMVTMLLGGLWHGAAWRFVIWGGLHGFGLVIHKGWSTLLRGRGERSRLWKIVAVFITFNFVSFCWIFFRAGDMQVVKSLLHQVIWSFFPGTWTAVMKAYSQVLIILVTGYILHFLPAGIKESYRGLFIRLPLIVKMVVVYILAIAIFNVQSADLQPFIYFRF